MCKGIKKQLSLPDFSHQNDFFMNRGIVEKVQILKGKGQGLKFKVQCCGLLLLLPLPLPLPLFFIPLQTSLQ